MKSDGTDQMNTVAKTAEYPFERLALRRDGASLWSGDVLWFISRLVRACSTAVACAVFSASDPGAARRALARRDSGYYSVSERALKLWDDALHKFSRL
jgi:hypothetical protein